MKNSLEVMMIYDIIKKQKNYLGEVYNYDEYIIGYGKRTIYTK